jgi:hypothetical protein
MHITIEVANDAAALGDAGNVREKVFGRQCYRRLPRLDFYDSTQILTLLARLSDTHEPVATMSVVETTDDAVQHGAFDLSFADGIRVARYTQLAVLMAYRGLHLPARMIAEARRRFVLPNQILYTWLLFHAAGAKSSPFCSELGFRCSEREFATEYGRSRVLVRKEQENEISGDARHVLGPPSAYAPPPIVLENEWLAH